MLQTLQSSLVLAASSTPNNTSKKSGRLQTACTSRSMQGRPALSYRQQDLDRSRPDSHSMWGNRGALDCTTPFTDAPTCPLDCNVRSAAGATNSTQS